MKYAFEKSDVPTQPHYAVLVFSSIYIPGDERSRTHPGHGYPESWEKTVKYISFSTEGELSTWISENTSTHFSVLLVTPKVVTTKVQHTLS